MVIVVAGGGRREGTSSSGAWDMALVKQGFKAQIFPFQVMNTDV